jgi:hypothetical protein
MKGRQETPVQWKDTISPYYFKFSNICSGHDGEYEEFRLWMSRNFARYTASNRISRVGTTNTLKMDAAASYETLAKLRHSKRGHVPKDSNYLA